MDDQLLGYLLNALEPDELARVESLLNQDAAAQSRLCALRAILDPLAEDADTPVPSSGLANRTIERITEPAPVYRLTKPHGNGHPSHWRRADVLVAATLMLSILGAGFPWVYAQRGQPEGIANLVKIVECKNNLRQMHQAFVTYCDQNGRRYPNASGVKPSYTTPGLIPSVLKESGATIDAEMVQCPAIDEAPTVVKSLKDVLALDEAAFKAYLAKLGKVYAYSLGYQDGNRVALLRQDSDKPLNIIPIMADCPPVKVDSSSNSASHSGKGQNLLFREGHVKFAIDRKAGFDLDIYRNNLNKVGPGVDETDAALASGWAQ